MGTHCPPKQICATEKLAKYDIKPLFVFNGIKLPPPQGRGNLSPEKGEHRGGVIQDEGR